MSIRRWDRGREAVRGELRTWLHRRRGAPVLAAPALSIEFDDGYRSAMRHALPLLEARGWHSTHYLLTGRPNPSMDADAGELVQGDEITELASRAHVGCHGATHQRLDGLSLEATQAEVGDSRATLEARIGRSVDLFAAPFGSTTADATAVARRTYRAQRVIGGPVNTAHGFDPWAIRGLMPRRTTTDADFDDILRRTRHRRGWAILVWHRVDDDADDPWSASVDQFRRQLDLIERSGIEVVSTTEMIGRLTALADQTPTPS